ncbi:8931_t:CDS:1, partial [Racocetra fulgida]
MASIEKRKVPNKRLSSYMSSEADGHCDEDEIDYSDTYIPHLFRLRGSVIPNVIYQTLFVTAFSAVVTAVYMKTNIKPAIPQTFIPVLGFV